jgi:hypothetical protein
MLAAATWVVPAVLDGVNVRPDPRRRDRIHPNKISESDLVALRDAVQSAKKWPLSLIVSLITDQNSTLAQYLEELHSFGLSPEQLLVAGHAD